MGPAALAAISGGAGAWAFARLSAERWPWAGWWPGWAFAVTTPLPVIAGTRPFALGLAFAVTALWAMHRRMSWAAVPAAAGAWLASPLALAFLAVAGVAAAVARPERLRTRTGAVTAAGIACLLALQIVAMRAFPAPDARYPFDPKDAVAIALWCAAGAVLARRRRGACDLVAFFCVYAVALVATLLVPSPLGGNLVRVTLTAGLPVMLVAAWGAPRRLVPLAAAAVAGTAAWQALPAVTGAPVAWRADASRAAFWAPAVDYLEAHGEPGLRVHVVATADDWEAYHLPRQGLVLTRGWFRQDDFPVNEALYRRPLEREAYLAWLRRSAAGFVLLPDDPLEPGAEAERRLLEDGALPQVARLGRVTVYRVPNAARIAEPHPRVRVTHVDAGTVRMRVDSPGVYRLRMRYSPYLDAGPGTCLTPRAPFGVDLTVRRAGEVDVRFAPTWRRISKVVAGTFHPCRPAL